MHAYHYDNNQVRLWVNYSTGTGFSGWVEQWNSGANAYSMARAKMVVADVTIFGPASLSSGIIVDLLRDEYEFDGLVVTDSLSMGGVTGQGPPEANSKVNKETASLHSDRR